MDRLFRESGITNIISRDIEKGMLNHAYMLISNDPEYITGLAKHVAKLILCDSHSTCNVCNQCVKIEKNEHADVVFLPNGKKNITTEDVETIVSESYVLPLEGDKKIYVLNNFDLATVQAQNKLLKTLEEPPKSVVFLVTATNEEGVLPTIRSRCKKIFAPQISDDLLCDYLSKKYPDKDISRVAKIADGNLTTAVKFLENDKMLNIKDLCVDIVNNFDKSTQVLKYSTKVLEIDELENLFNVLLDTFRETLEAAVKKDTSEYRIDKYSYESIMKIAEVIKTAIMKLKANCNPSAVVDYLLLGILEVRFRCQR